MRTFSCSLLVACLIPATLPAQDSLRAAPETLHRIAPKTPAEMRALFRPTGRPLPFVSGHRGGSLPGYPENCIETLENTLRHTFAILEVDPRYTRDGALVLMHDDTLERTSTGRGRVSDHTLAELKALRLKDRDGRETPYAIPTLDEALQWARGKTILVLDNKDVPVAERIKAIVRNNAETAAMVMAYNPKEIKECHELNPNIMLEVFTTKHAQIEAFDKLGVPWSHVIAFVGHTPPEDATICKAVHERGAATMAGTSRNLDLPLITGEITDLKLMEPRYRALLAAGVDLFETDIPSALGPLLHGKTAIPGGAALIPPSQETTRDTPSAVAPR
ncbi:MAG: glycerophosphodiester phosphodiesterase family protein [Planctomycetes bacterium]|nr:glycerophosphodiester phosphodiesterase family protein [Planctomycetota bacterium]